MRPQGIALKDHRGVALMNRLAGHIFTAKEDPPGGRLLEAADGTQESRLAASGRSQQEEQLAVLNGQADIRERPGLPVVLCKMFNADFHRCSFRSTRNRIHEKTQIVPRATITRCNNQKTTKRGNLLVSDLRYLSRRTKQCEAFVVRKPYHPCIIAGC